jgi:Uri superfamily endonuclease
VRLSQGEYRGLFVLRGSRDLNGTYTLILHCKKPFRVKIGSLGYANVGRGYCLYTGSALGRGSVSLEGRLKRHFRASKKRRWHVDYLTSHPLCDADSAVCLKCAIHLECKINRAILQRLGAQPLLPHAGSSDCNCEAHLLKVEEHRGAEGIRRSLTDIYEAFGDTVLAREDYC